MICLRRRSSVPVNFHLFQQFIGVAHWVRVVVRLCGAEYLHLSVLDSEPQFVITFLALVGTLYLYGVVEVGGSPGAPSP